MSNNDFSKDWQRVDSLENPGPHIDLLELAQQSPQFYQLRREICKALGFLKAGARGVDVGCGLGLAVRELEDQGWSTTGIDFSQTMVHQASSRYPGLDFRIGSAIKLPFDDGSLDFYRTERVYVTMPKRDAAAAIVEARRVLRQGGRIVLAEPDLETITFTSSEVNRDLTRAAVKGMADVSHNGQVGSNIRGQLLNAGFTDVHISGHAQIFTNVEVASILTLDIAFEAAYAKGDLSKAQIEKLREDLIEHQSRDAFQYSCTTFIISGSRG